CGRRWPWPTAQAAGGRRQATEDGLRAVRASPAHESSLLEITQHGRPWDGLARSRSEPGASNDSTSQEPAMTVLVTGATGLLGSHLTDLLLERGEQVRVLVQRGDCVTQFAHPDVEICWGHLGDRAALAA